MDVIELRGIRVHGNHGANPGEKDTEQPFDVDVTLEIDLRAAAASDALGDTLDYAQLHAAIAAIVQSTSFDLLERLAAEIVGAVLRDPRVARASVRVAKPGLLSGATPSVTLQRENPRFRPAFP